MNSLRRDTIYPRKRDMRCVIELNKQDELTMLDINLRQIIKTAPSNFQAYNRYDVVVPGMRWIPLSGELHNGEFECFMLRMEAGSVSKPHEHMGHEEFLILDGELIDCDGTEYRTGDYVHLQPGTKHSSHTPNGCTIFVILRGNNRVLTEKELGS